MEFLGPIAIALVTTVGGIAATWIASKRLSKLGLGEAQLQVNKTLREVAETETAKSELLKEKLDAEIAAHAVTRAERDRYRQEADDCDRRLNNVYSELRRTGQLADRRRAPRGGPG